MIYLDANATSRLRPEAVQAIQSFLERESGLRNPSSVHEPGRLARTLLSSARRAVSSLLLEESLELATLVFTSGGTEACNTLMRAFFQPGTSLVTTTIEHQAVLEVAKDFEQQGEDVRYVVPQANGSVAATDVSAVVDATTSVVCIMAANNVSGAVQPILEITRALRANGFTGAIITDATQAVLKSGVSFKELFQAGLDALAFSGHKLGAPAGVGGFFLRQDESQCRMFRPALLGGPQETRFRAGTENLLGVAALGAVAEGLITEASPERKRLFILREKLWQLLNDNVQAVRRLTPNDAGDCLSALSNTLLVSFEGVRGDDLVVNLDLKGVSVSTGSACSSGKQEPSYVMSEMGCSESESLGAIRLSLDWDSSDEKIENAALVVAHAVRELRLVAQDEVANG